MIFSQAKLFLFRCKRKLHTQSLKHTLIFYFLIFIILPLSIVTLTMYSIASANNFKNSRKSTTSNLVTLENSILQIFEQANSIADVILNSSQLQAVLDSGQNQNLSIANQIITLNSVIQNSGAINAPQELPIYTRMYLIDKPEYTNYNASSHIFSIRQVSTSDWFQQLDTYFRYTVLSEGAPGDGSLKFVRRVYNQHDGFLPLEGILSIDFSKADFIGLLNNLKITDSTIIFIVDNQSNQVLCSTGSADTYPLEQLKGENGGFLNNAQLKWQNSSYQFTSSNIQELGWTIVSATQTKHLNEDLDSFQQLLIPLILNCILTGLGLALLLSDWITKPIRSLVDSMKEVGKGNMTETITYTRDDEFKYLIQKYNSMVNQLDTLIYQLYTTEQKKKDAEMASLQAQINPHFLYNTLDSITMMAMWGRDDDVVSMVEALSDFFRYSLNKGKNMISLGDELAQMESYLKIQKMRYEDQLDYQIDAEQSVLSCKVLKLILQPLVENSIKHGIQPTGRPGHIHVICRKQDSKDIEILISDDGQGGNVEEINDMLTTESETNRAYGIKNVNWRIKNYYGDRYGLHYQENPDGGITAIVRIHM